ncbi:MAG TPA: metallophosphoesterase [Terracidiphilus sp.]
MSTKGFTFANPTYTADNFYQYSAGDLAGDANLQELAVLEAIPAPRVNPPVFDVSSILGTDAAAQIQASGKLIFHSVGDSGGIIRAEPQLAVSDAMAADLGNKTLAAGRPAFFFHLGDVVYYFGQEQYYPEQFYDPYRNYDAPIFAIPGNHDGVMYKNEPIPYSLQPFVDNFCAATPGPAAPSFARSTMTQPGVYFVMTAPFARIIGLYSNTSETTGVLGNAQIGQDQVNFLTQQLQAALAARQADPKNPQALIIAVHHPPFTGSSQHFPSATMLAQMDACCKQAGMWPDMVLSGHSHLYERYTRVMASDGRQIPFVVAGNGGYYNLSKMKLNAKGKKPKPGAHSEPDGQGNTINLDAYNETDYGFLRITVTAGSILVESLGITGTPTTTTPGTPIPPPTVLDSFSLNLAAHTMGPAAAAQGRPGKKKAGAAKAGPKKRA